MAALTSSRPGPGPRPRLSRRLLTSPDFIPPPALHAPERSLLDLPERAVQFGTGGFLRGFVDFFVDAANRQGRFLGRIVAISSTGSVRDRSLNEQDGFYTLVVQGVEAGQAKQEHWIIASVSRAVSAPNDWNSVLRLAHNPDLELVFSNTTEVGIAADPSDSASSCPPRSFPGKLTRFLFERAQHFDFALDRGVVVVPCELIENNGDRLREIVLAVSDQWDLGGAFTDWLERAVPFCNTLVDRIVTGAPDAMQREELGSFLGYRDELITVCEPYRQFVIEADESTRGRIGFASSDPAILLTTDVTPYRERKVRLLNGAHTILVPIALMCGCRTVFDAVRDDAVGQFIRLAMFDEIAPTVDAPGADEFAEHVIDRFANPFIEHVLSDISLHGTTKMRVRVVPSIAGYTERNGRFPPSLTFGFAAYLLFMRGDLSISRARDGLPAPRDDAGDSVRAAWASVSGNGDSALSGFVHQICSDISLWGADLSLLPGFHAAVADDLAAIIRDGARRALEEHLAEQLNPSVPSA